MILVFGGTTEGKQVIETLAALQLAFVYSTKTRIEVNLGQTGIYRYGAFTKELLIDYIEEEQVSFIIHASHPFASELHKTIEEASQFSNIPVIRLERNYPTHTIHKNVLYVGSYEEASELLTQKCNNKTLLALTGVQSISKLKKHWKETLSYFRILNRGSSISLALENKFPKEQLILGLPNKTVEAEVELIKKHNIEIVITKESGDSGSLSIKIDAALQSNIPIIIIKRPKLPTSFQVAQNPKELNDSIIHHSKFITDKG